MARTRDPYHTPRLPSPTPPGPHDLWDIDPTSDNREAQRVKARDERPVSG